MAAAAGGAVRVDHDHLLELIRNLRRNEGEIREEAIRCIPCVEPIPGDLLSKVDVFAHRVFVDFVRKVRVGKAGQFYGHLAKGAVRAAYPKKNSNKQTESGRKGRADRRCSKCFVEYMRAFRIQVVPKQLLHLASAKSYLCVVERVEKGCISDQKMLVNMQQFLEQAGIEVAAAKRRSCAQESSRQGSVRERGRGYQQALLLVGQGEIIRRRMAIYQQYRGAMEIALSMLDTEASFLANFFRLLDEKYDNGAAHHQSSLLQELVPVEGFMQKVICYMERGCPYIGTIIPFFSDAVKAKYGRELSERESYLLRGCLFGRFVKMFFLKIDAAFWDSHDSADESDLIVHLAMFKRAQHLSGRKEPFAKRGMRCLIQILDVIPDEYEEATFTEDMESLCRKVRCHFNTREKKAVLLAEMRGYIQHVQYDFTFPVLSLLRRRLLLRKASLVAAAEGGGGGDGK